MTESNEFLAQIAVALDQALNVVVALRLAVDANAGMTDSLKTATDEALQNLSVRLLLILPCSERRSLRYSIGCHIESSTCA